MISKKITLLIYSLFVSSILICQVNDTVHLEDIIITSSKSKFSPGTKIETISNEQLIRNNSGDISHILVITTPVYVKSYAGGLSTLSFRGTSSNHTNILYDGENFNSLTLGHSNLSDIPLFFFDEMEIQYGGASSLYGSGAIGGTLQLKSNPEWINGTNIWLQQDIASFDTYFSGIKFRIGNSKIESSTKICYKISENNFPFKNEAFKDFETGELIRQYQKNNSYNNYGILQELFYRANTNNILSVKYYQTYNWHEIQPTMSTNRYGGDFDELYNLTKRLSFIYQRKIPQKSTLKIRTSYINDFQLYNTVDTIATTRYSANAEYEYIFSKKTTVNTGINYSYITPDVYSYIKEIHEHNTDIYFSCLRELFKNGKFAVNIRNSNVTGFSPQYSPSAGYHHYFLINGNMSVTGSVSFSKSYKIPTFNNRYWGEWGNPDLKTETGLNYDANTVFTYSFSDYVLKLNTSLYSMLIDNWIQWVPVSSSIWMPVNFKKVHSRGIEFSTSFIKNNSGYKNEVCFMYSFNRSTTIETYDISIAEVGKQLAYSPKHNIGLTDIFSSEKYSFTFSAFYVGKRLNSNLNNELAGYLLLNISANRRIVIHNSSFDITAHVKNILNAQYINIENYAMPGINWQIGIKYNIIKPFIKKNYYENN